MRCCTARVAPIVRARTQVVYGNRNWVPLYIYGTTPSFLDVRQWDTDDGRVFTDQEVNSGAEVCVIGQTLVRELFNGQSPLGHVVRINNHPMTVIGTLTRKGANMMGVDQDDILLAPWTTIKYRVSGNSAQTANQSAAAPSDTSQQVNSLSSLYPSSAVQLYPAPSPTQAADTPLPVRFTNVDQILLAARSGAEIPFLGLFRPDKWLPFLAGRYHWTDMLAAGVKVYQYTRGMMHSKFVLVDGEWASVGSANMDNRSLHLNFELNCQFFDAAVVRELEAAFLKDLEWSVRLDPELYPKRPFVSRLAENACRLFSPVL